MDQKKILSQLVEIEKELKLFERKINGTRFWEHIRYTVFTEIMDQYAKGETGSNNSNSTSTIVNYSVGIFRNLLMRNPFLTGQKDAVFLGHPRRKLYSDGKWWDIYCDPVINYLDLETVYFERPYSKQHFSPPKTTNLKYLDLIIYSSPFAWRILDTLKPISYSESESLLLDSLDKKIDDRFGFKLNSKKIVTKTLLVKAFQVPLYERLLKHLDPDLAITVVGHNRENFLEACKNLGIVSVDLQHGTMNGHPGYYYPKNQYKQAFADYLLIWGGFWKEDIEFPIPHSRVIPVGFPYIEQSVGQYEDIQPSEQILFLSQATVGEKLSKFALRVHQHLDIEHDIVYKLHPDEYYKWQDEYPWLTETDFEVIDSSDQPLYKLFAQSTVQIGVYSTAVYEGLAFDLETYIYDCPGSDVIEPLIEEGSAELISSADDLAASLGTKKNSFESDYYFAPNATEMMCDVLQRLADQGTQYQQRRC